MEKNDMYVLDENICNLHRIFDQNERKDYLRLDLNENPSGLPQDFINEVLKKVSSQLVSQYPETSHFSSVLADYLGTNVENLCITNGSAEAIRYIIQAFTSERGRIVGVVPSYFMYQVYSEMYGREFIQVEYNDDLSMDVENILKNLSRDTQLCILMNPNNPMGNVYSEDEFEKILNKCKENEITLLIDEAYFYFHSNTFLDYALSEKRVFVTRTFSKLFSMAGCRLGYVVGNADDIKYVQKYCTPHNTNAFAMLFAEEIINTPGMVDQLIQNFNDGREYLIQSLEKNGYRYKGEAGNFIFIKPKTDASSIVVRMKEEKRILIKSYPKVGKYGDCLRVTIGDKNIMEQFISALLELDQ